MCSEEVPLNSSLEEPGDEEERFEFEDWKGPFEEGGTDTSGRANWFAIKDGQRLLFLECRQYGDQEGVAECRGQINDD